MTIHPFGNIEFNKRDKEWFGQADHICPDNTVELTIAADNIDQDLTDKIELIKKLAEDYETIVADLYDLSYKRYKERNLKGNPKQPNPIRYTAKNPR
jgi:hypothetical protein